MTGDKPWRNRPPSTITIAGVAVPREHFQRMRQDFPTGTVVSSG